MNLCSAVERYHMTAGMSHHPQTKPSTLCQHISPDDYIPPACALFFSAVLKHRSAVYQGDGSGSKQRNPIDICCYNCHESQTLQEIQHSVQIVLQQYARAG